MPDTAEDFLKKWGGAPGSDAQAVPGLLEPGNINLYQRPVVYNADGSLSSVRSMSFEEEGREILVPTVSDDGRILSNEDAIAAYRKTGKHLGKFKDVPTADSFSVALHNDYASG